MLEKRLEELKQSGGELTNQTGVCRFCGQIAQIETDGTWSINDCDEAVIEQCDCVEARVDTTNKRQRERAEEAICNQFGEKAGENEIAEEVVHFLNMAAGHIIKGRFSKIKIDIKNDLSAQISINSKGFVKVERKKTVKETREV